MNNLLMKIPMREENYSNKIITSKSNSIEQVVDNAIKYFTDDKK